MLAFHGAGELVRSSMLIYINFRRIYIRISAGTARLLGPRLSLSFFAHSCSLLAPKRFAFWNATRQTTRARPTNDAARNRVNERVNESEFSQSAILRTINSLVAVTWPLGLEESPSPVCALSGERDELLGKVSLGSRFKRATKRCTRGRA